MSPHIQQDTLRREREAMLLLGLASECPGCKGSGFVLYGPPTGADAATSTLIARRNCHWCDGTGLVEFDNTEAQRVDWARATSFRGP